MPSIPLFPWATWMPYQPCSSRCGLSEVCRLTNQWPRCTASTLGAARLGTNRSVVIERTRGGSDRLDRTHDGRGRRAIDCRAAECSAALHSAQAISAGSTASLGTIESRVTCCLPKTLRCTGGEFASKMFASLKMPCSRCDWSMTCWRLSTAMKCCCWRLTWHGNVVGCGPRLAVCVGWIHDGKPVPKEQSVVKSPPWVGR